jgi:hypothetical protein
VKKKKRKNPILIPEAQERMQEIRFEIAKKLQYVDTYQEDWWEKLNATQKSKINGYVTKLLVSKAQVDMINGDFKH